MGLFDHWTIISDIDGTLLQNGGMQVSEENKAAIAYWQKEGGVFALATGRYLGSTLPVCEDLNLSTPFVYNNGASIYDPGKNCFPKVVTLGRGIFSVVSDLLQISHCGIAGYSKDALYLIRENPSMHRHLARQNITPKQLKSNHELASFCKILITVETDEMEALKATLANKSYFKEFQFAQSTPEFYEITDQKTTKGQQILSLCALLNRPTTHLITVGDNENDVSSLTLAPYSFAVANATSTAKSAARFITQKRGDTESAMAEIISTLERMIRNGKI